MSFNADVVVVGAGPVGLWTAAQAKIRTPRLKIVLLEKHARYQRAHNLQIDPSSLNGIPSHPELERIVKEFRGKSVIPTNEIEGKLKRLCQRLGIGICYKEVTKAETLVRQFPKAKVFIGADGSHSIIRKEIFKNRFSHKEDLQYIAEVKYYVQGNGSKLHSLRGGYKTAKMAGAVFSEHVGHQNRSGQTPVTLRIFIDKATYDQMNEASFKHPYLLHRDLSKIDRKLREKIKLWLNAKVMLTNEKRVPGSEKITVTKLAAYAAEKVVTEEKNRHWCLVGDSAFGVPFFRSLNNGLLSGTKLAETLSGAFSKNPQIKQDNFEKLGSYQTYVTWLARWEILVAKIKNFILNLSQFLIWLNGYSPLPFTRWSSSQAQHLRSREFLSPSAA